MINKTKRYVSLALVLCMILISGCSSTSSSSADDYVEGSIAGTELSSSFTEDDVFSLNADLDMSFNPFSTMSYNNRIVSQLVYQNIYEVDDNFNLSTSVVTDYETADGSYWYLYINTDIIMHDGSNLTAYDVAYSIQQAMTSSRFSQRMAYVWGASATSDTCVAISLGMSNYLLPYLLTIPIVKSGSSGYKPVGSGPYMFNEDGTALIASEYWEGEQPIEEIGLVDYDDVEDIILAFENFDIDLVINDASGGADYGYGGNSETRTYTTTNMHYIGFNLDNQSEDSTMSMFVSNASYRYALTLALDRDYAANTIMDGAATASSIPISPKSPLYNESLASELDYDMDLCLQILNNAGVSDYDNDGKLEYMVSGIPMEINLDMIVCSDSGGKSDIAKKFVEDLKAIGITVTLRELSWDEYVTELYNGTYDIYYGEVMLTADFNLAKMFISEGTLNYSALEDENYWTLISDYLGAYNDEDRQYFCDLMVQYIGDQAVVAPILFEKRELITHRNVVSGINPSQYNIFYDIDNWKFNFSE